MTAMLTNVLDVANNDAAAGPLGETAIIPNDDSEEGLGPEYRSINPHEAGRARPRGRIGTPASLTRDSMLQSTRYSTEDDGDWFSGTISCSVARVVSRVKGEPGKRTALRYRVLLDDVRLLVATHSDKSMRGSKRRRFPPTVILCMDAIIVREI